MKQILIMILLTLSLPIANAEITSSEEELSFNKPIEISEEYFEEAFAKEEVTITPLFQFAGPGKNKANCNCTGEASYYGGKDPAGRDDGFHGKKTASGEIFDKNKMTAAHRCLPLGTKVRVCMVRDPNVCIDVKVNDRGPYAGNRILDLSNAAAKKLGWGNAGHAQVTLSRCK